MEKNYKSFLDRGALNKRFYFCPYPICFVYAPEICTLEVLQPRRYTIKGKAKESFVFLMTN